MQIKEFNPKAIKFRNNIKTIVSKGFIVVNQFDSNYQIVVYSDRGLVDYYSSTETFIFRKSSERGKGLDNLLSALGRDAKKKVKAEAKPKGMFEDMAMKLLRKRGYKIYED